MQREYMRDVYDVLKNGMSAEEVQAYFNEISMANNKKAKEFLKITSIGISRARKRVKANTISQEPQNIQPIQPSYQYQYVKNNIDLNR